LASCLPLLIQMPVFFIMYRVLHALSRTVTCVADSTNAACAGVTPGTKVFDPDYIDKGSKLWKSLAGKQEMLSFGLDLSKSPAHFISESVGKGLIYAALVVLLGLLYFVQQKMVASRAAVSPTMSATQAKLMQYLPVVFAVFQIFFLTGLVIYYIIQALFRIGQNYYITKKFYGHEDSLGRQAQAAGARAREEAKAAGGDTGGGIFAQAKRDAQARREAIAEQRSTRTGGGGAARTSGSGRPGSTNSRTNGRPANRPAGARPASSGKAGGKSAPDPSAKGIEKTGTKPPKAANTSSNGTNAATKSAPLASTGGGPTGATPADVPSTSGSKRTPPKNRPTPSANRPQRPGVPGRPKPNK
jgi:YidC/Oxa1 family membrane protein insertase